MLGPITSSTKTMSISILAINLLVSNQWSKKEIEKQEESFQLLYNFMNEVWPLKAVGFTNSIFFLSIIYQKHTLELIL